MLHGERPAAAHVSRLICFGLCAWLLYMGIFAKRGLIDAIRMKQQNKQLASKIDQAKNQRLLLERQINALEKNPLEQERILRQVLGFVRKNELIIEFD